MSVKPYNNENINIRATALKEFWGDEYNDSLFLWEGSKHDDTFNELDEINVPTFTDLFYTVEQKETAIQACKAIYSKHIPLIAEKLNIIHRLNLSESFWRTVFGYWFYRHICIVYEKYAYLSKLNIDKTSIKLLDKESFFIPHDHYEYLECFSNDFGVQQLVSQYYYLFGKKENSVINYKLNIFSENKSVGEKNFKKYFNIKSYFLFAIHTAETAIHKFVSKLRSPRIIMLGVGYTRSVKMQLLLQSWGLIQEITPPHVEHIENGTNKSKRNVLIDIISDNDFDKYLINSYYHCFPKMFIEEFRNYYDRYLKEIKINNSSYVVSEYWISNIPTAIYCAISKEREKHFIASEHSAGNGLLKYENIWIDIANSDTLLTTGWHSKKTNVVAGGIASRNINKYTFNDDKNTILLIGHSVEYYLVEFSSHPFNLKFIDKIKYFKNFIELVPPLLSNHLMYRPRKSKGCWDTSFQLGTSIEKVNIDNGLFTESIMKSRIVIIDHISSGFAEILLTGTPFLLISHVLNQIEDEYKPIFQGLLECEIMHESVESAVDKLNNIYEDIELWWKSNNIQKALNKLIKSYLAPPSHSTQFLLSCLKD